VPGRPLHLGAADAVLNCTVGHVVTSGVCFLKRLPFQPARTYDRTAVGGRVSLHSLVAGRSGPGPDAFLRRAAIESRLSLY
jgi:hypothetical protein